jgi:hypothetical protein
MEDQDSENVSQLRQMTLEQIRQLLPEQNVYIRFVVENASDIITHIRGYDTLVMEKQERKRKGPLIKAIRPTSFPAALDLREKYTERVNAVIWSTEEGTFYCNCGALWVLQAFSEQGEGKTLMEAEQEHANQAKSRRDEREREWEEHFPSRSTRKGGRK